MCRSPRRESQNLPGAPVYHPALFKGLAPPKYQQIRAPSHSTSEPTGMGQLNLLQRATGHCACFFRACAVHGDLHVLGRQGDVVHGVKKWSTRRRVVQCLDLPKRKPKSLRPGRFPAPSCGYGRSCNARRGKQACDVCVCVCACVCVGMMLMTTAIPQAGADDGRCTRCPPKGRMC